MTSLQMFHSPPSCRIIVVMMSVEINGRIRGAEFQSAYCTSPCQFCSISSDCIVINSRQFISSSYLARVPRPHLLYSWRCILCSNHPSPSHSHSLRSQKLHSF